MKLLSGLAWLAALRARRRERSAPDTGDMGTAFGLDTIQTTFEAPKPSPSLERAARRPWEDRAARRF